MRHSENEDCMISSKAGQMWLRYQEIAYELGWLKDLPMSPALATKIHQLQEESDELEEIIERGE